MSSTDAPIIYSIGHSDHDSETFISLLQSHGITTVVDVRTHPYSRWVPQANRETLAQVLEAAGITYTFMGEALGGRPSDPGLYGGSAGERPDYERVAATPRFQEGIRRLLALTGSGTIAIMCSEGDHHHCHRSLLITPTLLERQVRVIHIRPDGETVEARPEPKQLSLF
jgi:uncharacterized protein (DUF488 family)